MLNRFLKKTIINYIRNLFRTFLWYPYIEYLNFNKKTIFCECFLKYKRRNFVKNNWGDDLNYYLFGELSGKKIVNIPISKMLLKNDVKCYCLIGSIINFYNIDNKYIYGSGVMDNREPIEGVPKKIFSVRGPITRDYLLSNNIVCPPRYGDPALLLPLIYMPKVLKKDTIVVIPNMGTDLELVTSMFRGFADRVVFVDMRNYADWRQPIDIICSARYVISESLHGLIVAETYNIPNVWVDFKEHPDYWDIKFMDYYYSIGKKEESKIKIRDAFDDIDILEKIKKWKKGVINYNEILGYMPDDLKEKMLHTK